jgi:dihydrofolate synthase/folylpolyglutamate synthase
LGDTRTAIALDKCGIIKPGSNVVTCVQHEECLPVIEKAAENQHAKLSVYERDFKLIEYSHDELTYSDSTRTVAGVRLIVKEYYQRENAALAIRAATTVAPELTEDAVRNGLAAYLPPARQQLLPGMPPIIVDVAHNPIAFEMLAKTLREKHSERRIKAVIGMMKDKDARSCLTHLRGLVEGLLIVSTGNPRSYLPEELRDIALEVGIPARAYSENQYAYLDLHENRMITLGLVTGSFYVVGDYLQWRDHAGIA